MKSKFLFAFAGIALALGALAPTTAKADHYDAGGYYVTRFVGYDHCGRPVYQKVWVPVCRPRPVCPPPVCNPRPICPRPGVMAAFTLTLAIAGITTTAAKGMG